MVVADNLAAHSIGGFQESFNTFRTCRFCNVTKPDVKNHLRASSDTRRTEVSYNQQARISTANPDMAGIYGIKSSSVLNSLGQFHIINGLPSDIAHDLFESVVPNVLQKVILHCVEGHFALEDLNSRIECFPYSGSDLVNKPSKINTDINSFREPGESVERYITEIKLLSQTCNFDSLQDSLIRDRIVVGIKDMNLRERLLRIPDLNLEKCIGTCRASELSKERMKVMDSSDSVHAVKGNDSQNKKDMTKTRQTKGKGQSSKSRGQSTNCKYCGYGHKPGRDNCPAYGKECRACHKQNHLASMCKSKKGTKKVNQLDTQNQSTTDDEYDEINSVTLLTNEGKVNKLNETETSSPVNQIYAKMMVGENENEVLSMYNKTTIKPLGRTKVKLVNPRNNKKYKAEFVILDGECTPLLGSKAVQYMNLVKVQYDNIYTVQKTQSGERTTETLLHKYKDIFEGTGKLKGEYHLDVDPNIKPVVPQKGSCCSKDRLTKNEVITPVNTPTPWVSSLVTVVKAEKMRICIDPRDLNKALRRSHYPMPTIEDVLPDLKNAKVFSVLDAKNGFWHVELDEESSYLTTFNTPYGRYRWLRMPFGISTAPEEYQRRQDQAIEGLPGVRSIVDDILVFGEGDTDREAIKDHDVKLEKLMERCRETNLKLNPKKLKLKLNQVPFIGHLITDEGLKPDSNKVRAVMEMPDPTDVKGVQRKLTLKDTEWCWMDVHKAAVQKVKQLISAKPVLRYYDQTKELALQTDSSDTGLGSVITQEGQPVAYASRALTDPETRYAQIEKELLAVIFGLERFHDIHMEGR
ncbi:GagPol [Apostichopus japonicus]|uniref:GagPol n=1 Tax=Stichopus japonicus TaxID=307972 RepID=A0A2G8JR75_STIJA|nr:GagPol [Apostichopus japonicus]